MADLPITMKATNQHRAGYTQLPAAKSGGDLSSDSYNKYH
jgi:hypothetical protein